jgi:membrane-associated protease RseP (regulator of RpoE activity)
VVVERRGQGHFIFAGSPAELFQSVETSSYVPRAPFLPLRLPARAAKLLHYTASISLALALLNVVPCYMLDGQHIVSALLQLVPGAPAALGPALTAAGTALVAANLALGLAGVAQSL